MAALTNLHTPYDGQVVLAHPWMVALHGWWWHFRNGSTSVLIFEECLSKHRASACLSVHDLSDCLLVPEHEWIVCCYTQKHTYAPPALHSGHQTFRGQLHNPKPAHTSIRNALPEEAKCDSSVRSRVAPRLSLQMHSESGNKCTSECRGSCICVCALMLTRRVCTQPSKCTQHGRPQLAHQF